MINTITRLFTDTRAAAGTSIASAGISIELHSMPLIQQIAIVIAIISGLVAIVNGCDTFYQKHKASFKTRLFRHWETSLLGVFLLVIGSVALLTGRASLSELWPGIPTIAFLLYKKTPFKKPHDEDPHS